MLTQRRLLARVSDKVLRLYPSHDHRSCAFRVVHTNEEGRTSQALLFGGNICAQNQEGIELLQAMSYDGTEFATCAHRFEPDGRSFYDIRVNGKPLYRSDYDRVDTFCWLGKDRLGWRASSQEGSESAQYFVNGKNVTEEGQFELIFLERMHQAVRLRRYGKPFLIYEDGGMQPGDGQSRHASGYTRFTRPTHPASEHWSKVTGRVRVLFRGKESPFFDDIETDGGAHEFAYSDDGTQVGYIGVRYNPAAQLFHGAVTRVNRFVEEKKTPTGRLPVWALPLNFFVNKDFGVAVQFLNASRRFVPVVDQTPWKKGYDHASDHFFTPQGTFVVTVHEGAKARLVIDEDEGPLYDEICHVRYLRDDKVVGYIAREGDCYYAVTVH